VTVESRGHIVLAWFDGRTVLRETTGDIQVVWRDCKTSAESVGGLVQPANADETLVSHDSHARAEGSHTPESCA
jgi:hypothetical protein